MQPTVSPRWFGQEFLRMDYVIMLISLLTKQFVNVSSRQIDSLLRAQPEQPPFGPTAIISVLRRLGMNGRKEKLPRGDLMNKIRVHHGPVILCLNDNICLLADSPDGVNIKLLSPMHQFEDSKSFSRLPRWNGDIISIEYQSGANVYLKRTQALVTVILPVCNETPELLRSCLASLSGQLDPRFELLVIDQSDADKFAKEVYHEFRELVSAVHDASIVTLSGAINAALRLVRTPFASLLLSDDEYAPCAMAVLNEWIERAPDVDVFYTGREVMDESGKTLLQMQPQMLPVTPAVFYEVGSIVKHLICFRTELVKRIGGCDEHLHRFGPDDFDLQWTLAEYGARFQGIPTICYRYRLHTLRNRMTTDLNRNQTVDSIALLYRKHGVPQEASASAVQRGLKTWIGIPERDVIEKLIQTRGRSPVGSSMAMPVPNLEAPAILGGDVPYVDE